MSIVLGSFALILLFTYLLIDQGQAIPSYPDERITTPINKWETT